MVPCVLEFFKQKKFEPRLVVAYQKFSYALVYWDHQKRMIGIQILVFYRVGCTKMYIFWTKILWCQIGVFTVFSKLCLSIRRLSGAIGNLTMLLQAVCQKCWSLSWKQKLTWWKSTHCNDLKLLALEISKTRHSNLAADLDDLPIIVCTAWDRLLSSQSSAYDRGSEHQIRRLQLFRLSVWTADLPSNCFTGQSGQY